MKEYLIKHKKNRVYLKYIKGIDYKHYVLDCNEGTGFTKSEAKRMIRDFKYPENWEMIIKVPQRGEKSRND